MVDLPTIRIPVDVEDINKGIRSVKSLETGIKALLDAVDSGKISLTQFAAGMSKLTENTQKSLKTQDDLTDSAERYAGSVKTVKTAEDNLVTTKKKAETAYALAVQREKELTSARVLQEKEAKVIVATELKLAKQRAETAYSLAIQKERELTAAREEQQRVVQEAIAKEQMLANEKEILAQKYNSGYRAAMLYKAAVDEITRAKELEAVSDQRSVVLLEELQAEYNAFLNGTAGFNNRFQQDLDVRTKGLNRMGMAYQQLGYQAGDFLVQVQSGTNWMVAFGQQATQAVAVLPMFAGTLGMSATTLLSLATGLGVVIPLVTALGAAWMRTHENTQKAKTSILDIANAQKELASSSESLTAKIEMLRFGVDTEAEAVALKNILDLNRQIETINKQWRETDSLGTRQRLAEEATELKNQLSIQKALVQEINSKREGLKKAKDINEQMLIVELAHAKALGEAKTMAEALSGVDIVSGVLAARDRARELAEALGVSLSIAKAMVALADSQGAVVGSAPVTNGFNVPQAYDLGYLGGLPPALVGSQGGLAPSKSPRPSAAPMGIGGIDWGTTKSTGGGGGGTDQYASNLQSLIESLQTEQETVDAWYESSKAILEDRRAEEILGTQAHNQALLALEEEYQKRKQQIQGIYTDFSLNSAANLFQELYTLSGSGYDKLLALSKAFSAAQALVNTWKAYTDVLASGAVLTPWAKFAWGAKILAAGFGAVNAIKGVGSGGASSASSATSTLSSKESSSSPQTVYISGLESDSLFTGEQLQNLFDAFYDENDKRGKVFVVART